MPRRLNRRGRGNHRRIMKNKATSKFVIINQSEGDYTITFRDREHFRQAVQELSEKQFDIFSLDDRGRACLIEKSKLFIQASPVQARAKSEI